MSLLDLPREIFVLVNSFSNIRNLRLVCKYLALANSYYQSEIVDYTKDYSEYYSLGETIFDFKGKCNNLQQWMEPTVLFLGENIEKIDSVVIRMEECSGESFEFIANIFESNIACSISDISFELWFPRKAPPKPSKARFLSKFTKLRSLSLVIAHANVSYLDLILQEIESGTFTELKKLELCIRGTELTDHHLQQMERIFEQMKSLKQLTLEFNHVGNQQELMDRVMNSISHVPFLKLSFRLNAYFTFQTLESISLNAKDLSLRLDSGQYLSETLKLDPIRNLSKFEIGYSNQKLVFNHSLLELKIGTFESSHTMPDDLFYGNTFSNLKRLELVYIHNMMGPSNLFPCLEYAYCQSCQFDMGMDFFSSSPKLKKLILKYCTFIETSHSAFQCKDLEELDVSTSVPNKFFDPSTVKDLSLTKLCIYPGNVDLSAIENMSSLEHLTFGEYIPNFSFSKLTNLKYLEYNKNMEFTPILPLCSCESLLRNCVVYFHAIRSDFPIPTFSEDGKAMINQNALTCKLIASKLMELNINVKGVKFVIISPKHIYVAFNMQSKKQSQYSYPSFILFEREKPHSTVAKGRSSEQKMEVLEVSINYLMNVKIRNNTNKTNNCEMQ